jgi:hypothetical protein
MCFFMAKKKRNPYKKASPIFSQFFLTNGSHPFFFDVCRFYKMSEFVYLVLRPTYRAK